MRPYVHLHVYVYIIQSICIYLYVEKLDSEHPNDPQPFKSARCLLWFPLLRPDAHVSVEGLPEFVAQINPEIWCTSKQQVQMNIPTIVPLVWMRTGHMVLTRSHVSREALAEACNQPTAELTRDLQEERSSKGDWHVSKCCEYFQPLFLASWNVLSFFAHIIEQHELKILPILRYDRVTEQARLVGHELMLLAIV